jgi:hypothetical protein
MYIHGEMFANDVFAAGAFMVERREKIENSNNDKTHISFFFQKMSKAIHPVLLLIFKALYFGCLLELKLLRVYLF